MKCMEDKLFLNILSLFLIYLKRKSAKNFTLLSYLYKVMGFSGGSDSKESTCNAGDAGDASSIPGSGRSPGGGHGNPLQYSCLENPTDKGAWQATVHGVTKSRTRLSD